MNAVFADAYYYLALLSDSDAAHDRAVSLSRDLARRIVTTAWVLTEVADALAAPPLRFLFPAFYEHLCGNPHVTIVPPTVAVFERGIELYAHRSDKAWSLTDCISFVVMRERGLTDALTGDHHFEQAGFRILLK